MAHTKLICTSAAILLTLTACDTILFTEGRQLKARGEVEQKKSMLVLDHGGKKQTLKTRTFDDSVAVEEDDFRPTTPGNSPGVDHSYPEQMGDIGQTNKKIEGTAVISTHSMAGNADDFRPTMPGHSPGVGHSIHPNAQPNP